MYKCVIICCTRKYIMHNNCTRRWYYLKFQKENITQILLYFILLLGEKCNSRVGKSKNWWENNNDCFILKFSDELIQTSLSCRCDEWSLFSRNCLVFEYGKCISRSVFFLQELLKLHNLITLLVFREVGSRRLDRRSPTAK